MDIDVNNFRLSEADWSFLLAVADADAGVVPQPTSEGEPTEEPPPAAG
ncbi:hypothetical protein ACWEFL_15680 [Streptomyces sp. NPDC004838]